MFIRSERLFLRPGWSEDWQELLARIDDEAIVRNLASAPWPCTAEAARTFLERRVGERCPQFLVTLPGSEGARLIGCAGLAPLGEQTELGYWIARDHWNRGYATEAVRAVLSLARTLGHRRIVASYFEDNPASGRVLRKAGFCPTGEVVTRFSPGRGAAAPSLMHAITLSAPSDCDDEFARIEVVAA